MNRHQKTKQNSSDPQLPNIHHRNPTYNHPIFAANDYTKLHEKIRLPLETKFGTALDQPFMHNFEAIFKWCKKPSSLSAMIASTSMESEIKLDLTLDEILYHFLEGSLVKPNSIFKKNGEKSEIQSTSENQIQSNHPNPYNILNARNSPIYAEIPDLGDYQEIPCKGKLKIFIKTYIVFIVKFLSFE